MLLFFLSRGNGPHHPGLSLSPKEVLNFLKFVSVPVAKLKWGHRASYSSHTDSLIHGKESQSLLLYGEEQLLSKPQPHSARTRPELAHSRLTVSSAVSVVCSPQDWLEIAWQELCVSQ